MVRLGQDILVCMRVVAIDESGNTGQNLLDAEQPIFALASVLLAEQEADELVREVLGTSGREAKFTALRRSRRGRARLLELFSSPLLSKETVKLAAYHKRFALCAHLVDLLVEPAARHDGLDLYEGGASHSLAELLHWTMPVLLGEPTWEGLLRDFQSLVRERTEAAVGRFYARVRRVWHIAEGAGNNASDLLVFILASEKLIHEIASEMGPTTVDPAIPTFFSHCASWTHDLRAPFDVIHDESKPLAEDADFLQSLMRDEEPSFDLPGITLPLACRDLRFVPSKQHPQVQIADIVASATTYSLRQILERKEDCFSRQLGERIDALLTHTVWPLQLFWPHQLAEHHPPGTERINEAIAAIASGKSFNPSSKE